MVRIVNAEGVEEDERQAAGLRERQRALRRGRIVKDYLRDRTTRE